MTTRRIISTEKTILDQDEIAADLAKAPREEYLGPRPTPDIPSYVFLSVLFLSAHGPIL
jgi:hypothetical protein